MSVNEVRTKLGLPNRDGAVAVRKYEIQRGSETQRHTKRKEGHDDLISRLRMRASITITLLSGDFIHGLLQESDRFTITVRLPKEGQAIETAFDDPARIVLVYKHAIESFYLTKLSHE